MISSGQLTAVQVSLVGMKGLKRVCDSVSVCDRGREARRSFCNAGVGCRQCEEYTGRALRKRGISLANVIPGVELELYRKLAEL